MTKVVCPNRSSLAAIRHLERMKIADEKIQLKTDKVDPIQWSINGGHGLDIDKNKIYTELAIAISNSIVIWNMDTL